MADLERIIEEYLIKDLQALKETRVGYPTLMTVFAGVELLGSLLSDAEFGTDNTHFKHYWATYLYPSRPKTSEEADIIYEFVRHGVMHHFFPKGAVGVTGTEPGAHMTCRSDGILILDVKVLVDDFIRSYERQVKPLLAVSSGALSRVSIQKRLDDIRNTGRLKFAKAYSVFPIPTTPSPPLAIAGETELGASGPKASSAQR